MNYSNYTDNEIIESYGTMIEYSGKAEDAILAERK